MPYSHVCASSNRRALELQSNPLATWSDRGSFCDISSSYNISMMQPAFLLTYRDKKNNIYNGMRIDGNNCVISEREMEGVYTQRENGREEITMCGGEERLITK